MPVRSGKPVALRIFAGHLGNRLPNIFADTAPRRFRITGFYPEEFLDDRSAESSGQTHDCAHFWCHTPPDGELQQIAVLSNRRSQRPLVCRAAFGAKGIHYTTTCRNRTGGFWVVGDAFDIRSQRIGTWHENRHRTSKPTFLKYAVRFS